MEIAWIEKVKPKMLFATQCFVTRYQVHTPILIKNKGISFIVYSIGSKGHVSPSSRSFKQSDTSYHLICKESWSCTSSTQGNRELRPKDETWLLKRTHPPPRSTDSVQGSHSLDLQISQLRKVLAKSHYQLKETSRLLYYPWPPSMKKKVINRWYRYMAQTYRFASL